MLEPSNGLSVERAQVEREMGLTQLKSGAAPDNVHDFLHLGAVGEAAQDF